MTRANRFGPLIAADGVTFRLWAPGARSVALVRAGGDQSPVRPRAGGDEGPQAVEADCVAPGSRLPGNERGKAACVPMRRSEGDWFSVTISGARPGARYKFRIDDETEVPDPASRFQPEDVHGPSEVIDPHFPWQTADWKGRPWHECIFVELHVGTFTPQGTFRGVIEKLDHIAAAGFTAIELMPVADFSGRWNWGYDGVLPYAPDSVYGRPDDLKALIDAAHRRGLMMFLDVVYNHFGPEGNYLGRYAPQFFTPAQTPWGNAIAYELPEVRCFAVENALSWLRDYRFDGLRLDAVHAIAEPSRSKLLHELSEAAGVLAAQTGRHIHLVIENDANQASLLDPLADPPSGRCRAQWNDDYHHAFHVLLTGETHGYYGDYREPQRHLVRTLAEGFAYQGDPSAHRHGEPRGEPTGKLPATAFVNFLQNHDQIGNRAFGERLAELAQPQALTAALAITLLAPPPPLMFMGDEWGARQRFPFFCDFAGDLGEAVRNGRRREFAEAYAARKDVPDPLSRQTVRLATLDWSKLGRPEHHARLDFVRRLLAARKSHVVSRLPQLECCHGKAELHDGVLFARWWFRTGEMLLILANLTDGPRPRPRDAEIGQTIWGEPPLRGLQPWAVHASIAGA